ncbi:nitrate reductase subunit alpha [Tessaracoccus sp. MC1679]|uniref:nitrate reductase subunit alpha n=1 Tax=unclassified Tessaracoccus TaxID=2635419 RepID=UPI001603D2C1|nr:MULTISPECIES: nitrate reductase subunit alpha [unclassified Tessaracoccus]MBB1512299.1 nitrate reductase subunit alpha [Tessaracoccus sp. MC1627]MBB1515055.1 nitrate reductase subunit alpha [Tessaracoccus sp. MC1679]
MSTDSARVDGPASDALLKLGRFFTKWDQTDDGRAVFRQGGRAGDVFYRDRWSHDKVVRSTHGVNCTGSCSWKVYVKDGIITWESQQTDYPTTGPDRPEYEPRGCPRGAAFSWYTYSPTRVRYPYGRGVLIEMYREAKKRLGDPVAAFREISTDPVKRRRYQQARGKGGLVRISWEEALEISAASYVNTIKFYGPDRCVSFSPIPAMSMVSHAIGTRFTHLIGGAMTSFYDWYADLPVASPQVFGDQTDVPESGDWWDSTYLMMWGSNVPVTRTPDAHWMAEVRYRGTKVVTVAPDYADNVKFADEWLPAQAGTDAALAMAMGHVILKENFVDKKVEYFDDYVKQYTDLGMLITLVDHPEGHGLVPGKFLTAADLPATAEVSDAAFKTVVWDDATSSPAVPNGSMGYRYSEDGAGLWNLDLGEIRPALSLIEQADAQKVEISLPCFEDPKGEGSIIHRGVPARVVEGKLVTTVFDLMLAQYGVGRDGLPGQWPAGYDDATVPYTPAWQAEITSVPAEACLRIAREFAANSEESKGRTMIIIGAGICHWFHADVTYRAIIALLMMTGCIGKNGGGWAHYVGQEKCRPMTGWFNMANATDWSRPPRTMIGTAYWYMHTDQWRTDGFSADRIKSPLSTGSLDGTHSADAIALSHRLGWMPFYPQFDANPLDLADEAIAAVGRGEYETPQAYVAARLNSGELKSAVEDIDAPENWPRTMILWRSNLFGSSAKGNEYFLKHLLGTHNNVMENGHGADLRPDVVKWHDEAPEGKLDLLITADFRMTSSTLLSDIVLPAATWYEKYDLSSTDMHPFVHAFTPAIDPPWETKSDFDVFAELAIKLSELAKGRLDTRKDLVAVALQHDTPGQIAQPGGHVPDWRGTDLEGVPGKNMPVLAVVERDYTAIADKLLTVGPLAEKLGFTVKNITYDVGHQVTKLGKLHGVYPSGPAAGRPAINTDQRLAEAILMFSGTTNGELATQGFRDLERKTGRRLADLSEGSEEKQITFIQTQQSPQPVITSPEWSGSETGGRRYAAFTINTERLKPWHTLTGRMHFFLDHDWMADAGEQLPIFRPPLDMGRDYGEPELGPNGEKAITLRYITVHNKWSIHSEYQDNLFMLSLGRGGPQAWLSVADAASIGVRDNDWIELTNANGVFVARAVVTPKLPDGICYVQHAQERTIDVPKSEATGKRGGIHNSVTRILLKPTHLIGGYAHQAYAFNYIGPTGVQRDIVSTVRRRSQEVQY